MNSTNQISNMSNLPNPQPRILLVDDEAYLRDSIRQTLELEDYQVDCFANGEHLLKDQKLEQVGLLITDISMPGMSGLQLMQQINQRDKDLPVILITGHGDISMAVQAMRDGAWDFIEKPFSNDRLLDAVKRAMQKRQLVLENRQLKVDIEAHTAPGPRILGNSEPMRQLRQILKRVINAPADILIEGETGTGKELVSRYLHEHSNRQQHNFVAINCGAIPENLIESELFGHEAGAFTGAGKKRVGKFEHANGGTLFLDEIESMPISLQVKILRVLEDRKVEPLGSNKSISLDIRIVAATKTDLKALSDQGSFRSDLYYRLNLVNVHIPPLRQRSEDIALLFQHFTLIASARYQSEIVPLSIEQRQALLKHQWPGNVRELRNLAERYILMGSHTPFDFSAAVSSPNGLSSLSDQVEQFERSLLEQALESSKGNLKQAMEVLDLPRKTLYDKMKKHQLNKEMFKSAE
ncbi:sigma-54-dependent transcriptional regulator [Pelagibaculum spongiae]|uniref:DNA-binding response regulator n=1 Tax=Pelagibaculum spongiae TaxID=2080658 RepID=A0A2V1GZW4_9GAMM|nr:sigma-54 dependent transcriptional regulator [Pelagibaculum spongiae]PVZ71979.1 DNA-binding response regulator [Pelagibaculum spongiae]